MSLADEFRKRYSPAYVASITNADEPGANVSTTRLIDLAATDAEADFATMVQVAYDGDDGRHVSLAVRIVELYLLEYGAASSTTIDRKRTIVEQKAEGLKRTTARKRVTPSGTSTWSHETQDTKRPEFDEEQFDDLIPEAPDSSDVDS